MSLMYGVSVLKTIPSHVCLCVLGIIPISWKRYTVPAELTVIQWITDFTERIKQFQAISKASQTGGPLALKVVAGNIVLGLVSSASCA